VPEPGFAWGLGAGLAMLMGIDRRRRGQARRRRSRWTDLGDDADEMNSHLPV